MQRTVGNSYIRDRERRSEVLGSLKTAWYSKQVFQPPEGKTLLEYFYDRAIYQSGQYQFATKASLLRQARFDSEGESKQADSRTSFESHKKALTSKNEFNRTLLSHRTVFLFQLAKEIGEISDVKWLLVLNLFIFAITGEVMDIAKLKQICTMAGFSRALE
jgi:hypothetical protein